MRHLRDLLPKGQTLPDESWEQRHRWMVNLLWFHVAGLFAFSLSGSPTAASCARRSSPPAC